MNSGVMNNIMSSMYNVDPRLTYRQLNKQIYDETKMSFYMKNCDKPLSKQEIIKYINTKPKKIGIIILSEDEDDDHELITEVKFAYFTRQFLNKNDYSGESNIFSVNVDEHNDYVINNYEIWGTPSIDRLIEYVNDDHILNYDLLTIYRVYSSRKDCIKVNKNYARNKVLNVLDDIIADDQDSLYKIYFCYEYLLLNCFIFDIDQDFEELDTFNIKNTQTVSLANATPEEVLNYIIEVMDNPLDIKRYNKIKIFMLDEIERLTPIIVKSINNID